jgi:hypothetical protein
MMTFIALDPIRSRPGYPVPKCDFARAMGSEATDSGVNVSGPAPETPSPYENFDLAAAPDDVTTAIPILRDAAIGTPILGGDGLDIGEAWPQLPSARRVYFTTHA